MNDVIERYNSVKEELSRLEAQAAEVRRAWVVDGHPTPIEERVELDARLASLRHQKLKLRPHVVVLRQAAHQERGNRMLTVLIAKCRAAGRGDLVDAARREVGLEPEAQA